MAGKVHVVRYEQDQPVTLTASAEVTGGQLVAISGDRSVAPTAADGFVIGTVIVGAKAGEKCSVRLIGDVIPLTASGAVAAGDLLAADANGQAKPAGALTGHQVFGAALTAASGAGTEFLAVVR